MPPNLNNQGQRYKKISLFWNRRFIRGKGAGILPKPKKFAPAEGSLTFFCTFAERKEKSHESKIPVGATGESRK
jgi:hypothetical protein